jgi:hypothetical protein
MKIFFVLLALVAPTFTLAEEPTPPVLTWVRSDDAAPSFTDLHSNSLKNTHPGTLRAFANFVIEYKTDDMPNYVLGPMQDMIKYPNYKWDMKVLTGMSEALGRIQINKKQWKFAIRSLLDFLDPKTIPNYVKLEIILEQPAIIDKYASSLANLRALIMDCGWEYYETTYCSDILGE